MKFQFIRYADQLKPIELIKEVEDLRSKGLEHFQEFVDEDVIIASDLPIKTDTFNFIKDNLHIWDPGKTCIFRNRLITWLHPEKDIEEEEE